MTRPEPDPAARCWCGNADLVSFSPEYRRCATCETLVAARRPAADLTRVGPDEQGLYGRDYWFAHQERDINLPNLRERTRADLPERCVHWLRTALKYKLPPARVQELGSAHGGFVALLRSAGYDATGLELSPWVVDYARQTFGVPMLQGPLEAQSILPESLDVLAQMDVLEHLPDPLGTTAHAARLLKPDGLFIVQTPCYPAGASYEDLVARNDYFLKHMHEEHLFLFSRQSAEELFRRIGYGAVSFEAAIFWQYDMYFVAAREPIPANAPEAIDAALAVTPSGRFVQALLDAAHARDEYHTEAGKRLEVINGLVKEIERLRTLAAESVAGGQR